MDNILSPQLHWIEGRCYRINSTTDYDINDGASGYSATQYHENDLYPEDADEDDYDITFNEKENRYKTSYHVPQVFYAQIIGTKGMTKKRIESETKTQILIPNKGSTDDKITIYGTTRKSVSSAHLKIDLIILAARNKQTFTHFLCVPITNIDIIENYKKFRDDILEKVNLNNTFAINFDKSLFQNPLKLHLTIATIALMDNDDRLLASTILQECKETVIEPILQQYGIIELNLKGLEYMNDDPSEVDVLYGKIISEPMQLIVDGIADRFIKKGLMQRKTDKVKLHVTLINSKFREEYDPDNSELRKFRKSFDARNILKLYENYDFGVQQLNEIHLSQRFSTSNDGFYEATAFIIV